MNTNPITEVIFVGLPGPTHNYGGLSADNKASTFNRGSISNPKQAALQALELVRLLKSLGIVVAIMPPQLRPHMPLLRQHFSGEDDAIIAQAAVSKPHLLEQASAASAMWTANAATVTPTIDATDGKLHLTTANLYTNLHRRIEAEDTHRVLQAIFKQVPNTLVHPPLPDILRDEGAANHMRLSPSHSDPGLHVLIYGSEGDDQMGRQYLVASEAIVQQHRLSEFNAGFICQSREALQAGVFHNDVIAVSNENLLLVHEHAYEQGIDDIESIAGAYQELHPGHEMAIIVVSDDDLNLEESVRSYFFNSQIVTKPNGGMALIAPIEVQLLFDGKAADMMERLRIDAGNPIDEVHYIDLRQSMRNGGGPACLRLRVPMDKQQLAALGKTSGVIADEYLTETLERIIHRHYPDALTPEDLGDPALYHLSREVMQVLAEAMQLPLV